MMFQPRTGMDLNGISQYVMNLHQISNKLELERENNILIKYSIRAI